MPHDNVASRRKSVAIGLREQVDNVQHEVILSLEGTAVVCIASGERSPMASDADLEIRAYHPDEMSQGLVDRMEPPNANPPGTAFHVLVCERTVINLSKRCIVVKSSPRVFAILLPSRFVELRLNEDPDTVDEEEVELLEQLVRDHAELRVKGVKPPKGRVPVALTEDGKPLEDGIGDIIGGEVRSAAHFLAKRIVERRGELCDSIRNLSRYAKRLLKECPPGSELRIQQGTLDNLRRAGLVCTNAAKSVNDNKGLLRGVSKQVGGAVGDEFQESVLGQRLTHHRGLREARRVLLATMDGSDELFSAAARLPEELLKAVFDAVLDVVGHVWGDRAAEGGNHSLGILAEFLATKWAFEWAYPSALAFCGIKALLHTACDNPSNRALEHMEHKQQRHTKEQKLRQRILDAA